MEGGKRGWNLRERQANTNRFGDLGESESIEGNDTELLPLPIPHTVSTLHPSTASPTASVRIT